ncbi:MAG TPA: hypothetical protein VFR32_03680 [Gaiellaceae bacterium]|nr:hypothetical protein [Gaiellaceae bacterium]
MPKRTTAEVRREIDAERTALVAEIHGLRQDAAGALPYAIGTALALAVLTRSKTARLALKALWWLR